MVPVCIGQLLCCLPFFQCNMRLMATCCSHDYLSWTAVDNGKVFTGNKDKDTVMEAFFDNPVVARYLRVEPVIWHNHISMRADAITECG